MKSKFKPKTSPLERADFYLLKMKKRDKTLAIPDKRL